MKKFLVIFFLFLATLAIFPLRTFADTSFNISSANLYNVNLTTGTASFSFNSDTNFADYADILLKVTDASTGTAYFDAESTSNGNSSTPCTSTSCNFNFVALIDKTISPQYVIVSMQVSYDFGNYTYYVTGPVCLYSCTTPPPGNLAPVVGSIPNATVNEGGTYSFAGSFTDPDSSSWTATVDYGDGSGVKPLTLSGQNFSLSHQYTNGGTYTIIVKVTDEHGAYGLAKPIITVPINVTSPNLYNISIPDGTASLSFNSDYNFSNYADLILKVWDTSRGTVYFQGEGGNSRATCTSSTCNFHVGGSTSSYPQYVILTIDASYDFNQYTTIVSKPFCISSCPTVNALSNSTINVGNNYSANGSFTDAGSTSWSATVNYGDNSGTQPLTLSGQTFVLNHTYSTLGTYTVNVSITNNQGFTFSGAATVTVIPVNGLTGSNLSHANYSGANFSNQDLSKANLSVGTFNNVNFENANLSQVNGSNSSFTQSDFTGANLNKVNLSNSNLSNSNFTNAILTQADLSNANLTNVNFTGANLQGANMSGTTLTGVVWSNTTCPNGTNSNNHNNSCVGQGGGL